MRLLQIWVNNTCLLLMKLASVLSHASNTVVRKRLFPQGLSASSTQETNSVLFRLQLWIGGISKINSNTIMIAKL